MDKGERQGRDRFAKANDVPLAIPQSESPTIGSDLVGLKWSSDVAHPYVESICQSTSPVIANTDFQQAAARHTVVLTPETVYLLKRFRHGLATWMDVFDRNCTYQREVCQRALTSDLLLRCICALTARQLCLLASGEIWTPVATKYYSQSLNLLIRQLSSPESKDEAMSAVMLLSSYEVLAAPGQEHHKHYDGAMNLIRIRGINARSIGLDKANFWIWIRHEITVAIVNKSPLQMSPKYWNIDWQVNEAEEDTLGNQVLWLVGRAVDWIYQHGTPEEYHHLLKDSEGWYMGLPIPFRGVYYGEPVEYGLSKIHFATPAAGESSYSFANLPR